ncbi:g2652 [Coccomyxa viridis]|uniref:G2652 protein n=1 Tax=Coccomyxa viridis TaxID=1274662 RepID=A0ABP1FKW8_9CHLO
MCRQQDGVSTTSKRPQEQEYEFMGPWIGPLGIMLGLPGVCYALVYTCNAGGCDALRGPSAWPGFPKGSAIFTWEACVLLLCWLAFQVVIHLVVPGAVEQGTQLSNGKKLKYKLTGTRNLVITLLALAYFGFYRQMLDLSWVYDNFVPLLSAATLFSFALSAVLYTASLRKGALCAKGGCTGHRVYDFFIGRELNPRIGSFDLKEFCELYPGLIGWLVIDLAMAYKQWQDLGHVTVALIMVCAFHGLYVWDAMWSEKAILTTMDITTDGFGFMLVFGDLTWVPFTYSLQARYLVDHPQELSWAAVAAIVGLKAFGYWVFRGSNSQKNTFRQNPEHPGVRHLKTLKTASGRRLLVSGWWGVARHINYFGDWLMAWAWCLPCGFRHIVPYFYVIYFGTLLVHRDLRDGHACKLKYGKDWDEYCSKVKYRIVPYIY